MKRFLILGSALFVTATSFNAMAGTEMVEKEGYDKAYVECKETIQVTDSDEQYLNMLKSCLEEKGFENVEQ